MNNKVVLNGLMLIIFSVFLVGCTSLPTGNNVGAVANDQPLSEEDYVKIPISSIPYDMQKFSLDANGIGVNYFVVLGSDGQIRTAFDACDVCGGHKGYSQRGFDVVCDNCGRVFKIDDVGSMNAPGGCWPSFLDHQIQEGNVWINKAEIARGAFRFA